jgi:uncharacterized iron-regulated membrane protein
MGRRPAPRRSAWFTIHRWLGIGLGAWFALVGLTGSLLVFDEDIDAWLNPQLLRARSEGVLAAEAIVERAAQLGFGGVERIRFPQFVGDVYRVQLRATQRRVGAERIEALFDPGTGQLLGTRGADALGLAPPLIMRTLYEFHRNVLLGPTGSNIVGIAGLLLLTSSVTGTVLAWPRRRTAWHKLVWINRRASATRQVFDLHRSAGALFAVLMLLATLTGATLVYLNYVRDLVDLVSPVKSFPTVPWRAAPQEAERSLTKAIERVRGAFPEHTLIELRTPVGQLTGYEFFLKQLGDVHRLGDTILWVHPVSGEILVERSGRTRSGGESFMHWLYPLHTGSAFGTPGLVAMCATGLLPLLLVSTGLWVWLRKRRGERIGRERRREAAAGAQRAHRGGGDTLAGDAPR